MRNIVYVDDEDERRIGASPQVILGFDCLFQVVPYCSRVVISADQVVMAPGDVASFRIDSGKRRSMALDSTTY